MGWTKGKSRKGQGAGRGRGFQPGGRNDLSRVAMRNKAAMFGTHVSPIKGQTNAMIHGRLGKRAK